MTKGLNTAPYWLDVDEPTLFPDVERALIEPDGLLAIGGDLCIERLCAAYQHGIFPWYSDGQPILWWSPNPRAVLFLDDLKISRSLQKVLRNQDYRITLDTAFDNVIQYCAQSREDSNGTWIVDEMQHAYLEMHAAGFAHSAEVWQGNELIGGLYGVSLGGAFFGESMFSRQNNGSKIALVYLVAQLKAWGFGFIDSQVYSDHLGSLGATNIPRKDFIRRLNTETDKPTRMGPWQLTIESINKNKQAPSSP